MLGFGLLMGHLLGDYTFQNDWMAREKVHSSFACAVHCTVYTLCVFFCATVIPDCVSAPVYKSHGLPWWGYLVCWLAHFPLDRWRLARKWMSVWPQDDFATGPCAPWSIIVVDNVFHLFVLYLLGLLAV